jgi:hypothetical protein
LTGSLGFSFNRPEPRVVFAQFNEGLRAELPKKNGWTLSERAGHDKPRGVVRSVLDQRPAGNAARRPNPTMTSAMSVRAIIPAGRTGAPTPSTIGQWAGRRCCSGSGGWLVL